MGKRAVVPQVLYLPCFFFHVVSPRLPPLFLFSVCVVSVSALKECYLNVLFLLLARSGWELGQVEGIEEYAFYRIPSVCFMFGLCRKRFFEYIIPRLVSPKKRI